MRKTHLHKLPFWRHPLTRARAVLCPIYGSKGYTVDVYKYKARIGCEMFRGLKSEALNWLSDNGYPVQN